MSIDLFTSQQTDEWSSPREVVEPIAESIGGFDLDPCSGAERSPFADECYTEDEDGLGQWWHRAGRYASAVCFTEGRLSFGDAGNSAPFPSHVFVFGDVHHDLARTLSTIGSLCSPRRRQ